MISTKQLHTANKHDSGINPSIEHLSHHWYVVLPSCRELANDLSTLKGRTQPGDYDCGDIYWRIPSDGQEGRKTLCVAYPCFREGLLRIPNFPQPVPQPQYPNSYSAKYINDTIGLGAFATRNIAAADIIITERPILFASIKTSTRWRQEQLSKSTHLAFGPLDKFEPEEKKIYLSLKSACEVREKSNPFFSRFFTNMLPVYVFEEHLFVSDGEMFVVVGEESSRLNHR